LIRPKASPKTAATGSKRAIEIQAPFQSPDDE
jgi:hypothetical protein